MVAGRILACRLPPHLPTTPPTTNQFQALISFGGGVVSTNLWNTNLSFTANVDNVGLPAARRGGDAPGAQTGSKVVPEFRRRNLRAFPTRD